jgi:hypothetical protein
VQVAEGSGFGGAGFDTGWHHIYTYPFALFQSPVYPVKTKGAFLYHAPHPLGEWPGPYGNAVGREVRAVVLFFCLVFEVKTPDSIGAGNDTISATDTSPEVLHNNAIIAMVGCFRRAHDNAGGIFTMHAGHADELNPCCWIFTAADRYYPVPVNLSSQTLFLG